MRVIKHTTIQRRPERDAYGTVFDVDQINVVPLTDALTAISQTRKQALAKEDYWLNKLKAGEPLHQMITELFADIGWHKIGSYLEGGTRA